MKDVCPLKFDLWNCHAKKKLVQRYRWPLRCTRMDQHYWNRHEDRDDSISMTEAYGTRDGKSRHVTLT